MKYISVLREGGFREFAYHLEGLLDAADKIREMVGVVGEHAGSLEERADALTTLQVEIFDHLLYHVEALSGPMSSYVEDLYATLDESARIDRD